MTSGRRRQVAETYAGYARDERKRRAWDAANPGNAAIRDELTAAALAAVRGELEGGGELLDAGCGSGWWLRRLRDAGVVPERLHGVDLLPERVEAAGRAIPGASITEGDVRALPFAEGRFAAVFLLTVLSSVGDRGAVLAAAGEAWRVLAPGGMLVVWEPRVLTPRNRATRLVRSRDLRAATGVQPRGRTLTLLPPLARRVPRVWYPRLARVPALRTHRLHLLRRPDG